MERKVVRINKACEIADVSRRTIYNWMAAGKVEYVRTAGGSVRIYEDTLLRCNGKLDDLSPEEDRKGTLS